MNEAQTLIDLISRQEKLAAMLAPSFPIVFPYPAIITKLRQLGFTYVIEVAAGAKKTNEELAALLKANPQGRYITSPCPTIVKMIKERFPEYAQYLTPNVDSPMAATAKIVNQKYPGYRPVFIGPCVMKKMSAESEAPGLNILVITYAELQQIFDHFQIKDITLPSPDQFDLAESSTRIYPIDGGLSHTSGLTEEMIGGKIKIVSGAMNNVAALQEFAADPTIKILDILNCPGGCISGPGIISPLTTEERQQKVLAFAQTPASPPSAAQTPQTSIWKSLRRVFIKS